jgi:hypothetical protein
MPPCRSSAMSSMLSAPATIPATSERPPSAPRSRPCRLAQTGALGPAGAGQQTPPTRPVGPAPPTTPDSGRRTPLTSFETCERVSLDGCPSSWTKRTLDKSHSPSPRGHPRVTAPSHQPCRRWIEAKAPVEPVRVVYGSPVSVAFQRTQRAADGRAVRRGCDGPCHGVTGPSALRTIGQASCYAPP